MKATPRHTARLAVALSLLVGSVGCVEVEELNVGETTQTLFSNNGIMANGIMANGIMANGIMANGVSYNALGYNGNGFDGQNYNGLNIEALLDNAVWQYWMTSPEFVHQETVFDYLVGCALEPGQTIGAIDIDGKVFGPWEGRAGLAPDWHLNGNDAQTEYEQRAVSACLISLVNALGKHVTLSLRADLIAPPTATEMAVYARFEGQFFGNLFAETQVLGSCRATGESNMATDAELRLANRLCAADPTSCGFQNYGSCSQVCSSWDASQGIYTECAGYPAVGTYISVP